MEKINIERLEADLGNDPLYAAIQRMNLTDLLFDDETLSVLVEMHEYTTTDFEKWFCVNELDHRYLSTPGIMRSFVKELSTYLETRTIGRTIIIDYLGVIKLKMALLLRKNGMKPALIYETAGAKAYSPSVVQRGQPQPQSLGLPKSQKDIMYEQLMESLFTQLTAAGAVKQTEDGRINVDLRVLIEKQMELMGPALLPPESEETKHKFEILDNELSRLKDESDKNGQSLHEIKRIHEETIGSVTESVQELEGKTSMLGRERELERECKKIAADIYEKIRGSNTSIEMEELTKEFRKLEEQYPEYKYVVFDFLDKSGDLVVKKKLEEKQQREQLVKEECLSLYNVMIDPGSSKNAVDSARNELMKIQEENKDISFEIRSFLAAHSASGRDKERSGGIFSWFRRSSKH